MQGLLYVDGVMCHSQKTSNVLDYETCLVTYFVIDGPLTTSDMENEDAYLNWDMIHDSYEGKDGAAHIVIYLMRCKYAGRILMQEKDGHKIACNCKLIDDTIALDPEKEV